MFLVFCFFFSFVVVVVAFEIFSLSLILDNFIIKCLGEDVFALKLFTDLCIS